MSTKTQQLFKQNLQTIPAITSPKDLGYILIQYCQDIAPYLAELMYL
ncbi:MAG: hypothetical protein NT166_31870 [Candidatus Aminicenantes bacterium]|nr:hypothetical protein [Candidatus Aminicenantes bacterium]